MLFFQKRSWSRRLFSPALVRHASAFSFLRAKTLLLAGSPASLPLATAILTASLALFFASIPDAYAGSCLNFNPAKLFGAGDCIKAAGNTVGDWFFHAIEWVLEGIADLFWTVSLVGARFLSWVLLELNQGVGFYSNNFVLAGWTVTRDIANWFFIVLLLVAAISTILNIEQYNVRTQGRRFLVKLIILALLINFSLYFLSFAVNVAQSFMLLFVKNGLAPYGDVGMALHNALSLGNLHGSSPSIEDAIRQDSNLSDITEEFPIILYRIIQILFAAGAAFIFFYLAIMFIVRIIFLWITLILSPLAFLARIAPGTSRFYTEWSNTFFSNLFFGIIGVFFIWLATWLADYLSDPLRSWGDAANLATSASSSLPGLITSAAFLMQYITVFAFLWLSMVYSKKFAGDTAKATTQALAVGGVVGGAGVAAVGRLRQTRMMQDVSGRAQGTLAESRVGRAAARLPVLRGAVRRAGAAGEGVRERATDYGKQVGGTSDQRARNLYDTARNDRDRLAVAEALSQEGRLHRVLGMRDSTTGVLTPQGQRVADRLIAMERNQRGAQSYAVRQALVERLDASPTALANRSSEINQVFQRIRSGDIAKQSEDFWGRQTAPGVFAPPSAAAQHYMQNYIQSDHILAAGREAATGVVDAMVNAVNASIRGGTINARFHRAARNSPGLQAVGIVP